MSYRRDVDDVRQSALNALDELVEIYRSTDPALGAASEKSKQSKALAALRLASRVTSELIEWAESHVMGAIYREDHGKKKSKFKADSHANELQLFGDEIELTANQWRLFIGKIIREMAPSSRDWRQALALALFALTRIAHAVELQKRPRIAAMGRYGLDSRDIEQLDSNAHRRCPIVKPASSAVTAAVGSESLKRSRMRRAARGST